MADHDIKNAVQDIECPVFENPAFTTPPIGRSLLEEQDDFAARDTSYRALDVGRRDYMVGHWSPNFDSSGVAADLNASSPLTGWMNWPRKEQSARGHASASLHQVPSRTILYGRPAGAALLKEQGVDVVLLTPV